MRNKLRVYDWSTVYNCNIVDEAVILLSDTIVAMFNECFPLIKVKVSTCDPPYMTPLLRHLCKIRNKQITRGANNDLQERINRLIRENHLRAVCDANRKYSQGSKGWWDTVNKITGRSTKSHSISSSIDPHLINWYFQKINTDIRCTTPELLLLPDGTRIPVVDVCTAKKFTAKQQRTATGPDGLPYCL